MSYSTFFVAALVLLSQAHSVFLQDISAQANANVQLNSAPLVSEKNTAQEELKNFEIWKKSPLYLPSFEPDVLSIPAVQREFVNNMVANDMELFREILREAIAKKNNFAPSVSLMWKYTGKLLSRFIKNRKDEQQINPRREPSPAFFESIANLAEQVINRSDSIKKEMGYNKNSVNTEELYQRVDNLFKHMQRLISTAPVGAYLKWDEFVVYKDEEPARQKHIIEEAADLTAQFRGMGYDKCIFVARRIINLLRMFSKGFIPTSEKEV